MKKLLLIPSMVILTLSCLAQQGVWISKSSGFVPTSSGVRDIFVVDTNVAWMIAYDGDPNTGGVFRNDYSKTIDGGNTWTVGYTPANAGTYDWSNICALNADTAWALSFNSIFKHGGLLYKTTDGGANWVQQADTLFTSTTDGFPNNVHFFNANDGVLFGDPIATGEYEIFTSNDGGATWTAVDTANIPNPQDVDEAAWTNHYQAIGDTIWFDTNEGRVYRSTDRGLTWTVAHTTLAIVPGSTPQQAIDICFTSGSYGIARYYEDATMTNTVTYTMDGGDTWDTLATSGNLFGGDIANIPGTNVMVSTGISSTSGFTGTSYSTDGGATWITVETGVQRGSLGIADSTHMWCGGFSASPTLGGVFSMNFFPTVACNDGSINPGTASSLDNSVCDGDSVTFSVTGFVGPEDGYYSGVAWLISSADISGSIDPLAELSVVASHGLNLPAAINSDQLFINDGALIDGVALTYGVYYWTPVFFGNAANADPFTAPAFLFDLTLDLNCVYTGNSVPMTVYAPNDINCANGISEINSGALVMNSFMKDINTLQLNINSVTPGKAFIQIMDLTGRTVYSNTSSVISGANQKTINVSNLATGTYIVKASVNGNVVAGKVVKY